jgi:hypothetical protein
LAIILSREIAGGSSGAALKHDENVGLLVAARIPPIVHHACLYDSRLTRAEPVQRPRDLGLEPSADNGKPLAQVRMNVLPDDRRSRPRRQVHDHRPAAAILRAAQHHGVFSRDLVLVDIAVTRHG